MAEDQIRSVHLKCSIRELIREGLALTFGYGPYRPLCSSRPMVVSLQVFYAASREALGIGNEPTMRLGETDELQGGGDDIRCPLQDHAIV
jgi:hypothetical protein